MIVTGEIIKSAISLKIRNSLKTGEPVAYPTIFKEPVAQGFTKPSFHISTIDVGQKRISKSSYERLYQMNIRYYVDQKEDMLFEKLEAMGNTLLGVLNAIDVPILDPGDITTTRPVQGINMEYKVSDNILQYFVNFNIKVTPVAVAETKMETLTVNQV